MTPSQVELVEYALRQVTGISRPSWADIPIHLHRYFAKYMTRDVWTGEFDPGSLSEAALIIVRNAIMHTNEFADHED